MTPNSIDSVLYQERCLFIRLHIIIILIIWLLPFLLKQKKRPNFLFTSLDADAKAAGGIQLRNMQKAIESMLLMVSNILWALLVHACKTLCRRLCKQPPLDFYLDINVESPTVDLSAPAYTGQ